MFGVKISEKVAVLSITGLMLLGYGVLFLQSSQPTKTVHASLRTENATCEIGTVSLSSTDSKGNAVFSVSINNACRTAGKWMANTAQYHYSKGFVGISRTIPNLPLVNDTFTVPNLGNNGYEEKIVQFLFYPNTKQVASEKDIVYWNTTPTIYKSKTRTLKATCVINKITPGNVSTGGIDLSVSTSPECGVTGKWLIEYTMSFNNSSNILRGSQTASVINSVIHIPGITSAYRNEVSVTVLIQFFPNSNQEQSFSVAEFSV